MCLTLTLTFQGHLTFENSPFVTVHDWYTFRSDMFIDRGDIAHWNMEKLPILYNGNFRCHGKYVTFFGSIHFVRKLHRIGPSNIDNIQNRPWPLTFIWPWPWVWPLTLTIWRNYFFPNFFDFFKVTWRKNVTSYVNSEGRLQKRHSIRNVAQPSRRLYHFRFKSYGPLCDFQWFF